MIIMGAIFGDTKEPDPERLESIFKVILFYALLPSIISFYIFYFIIFPKYLQKKKYFSAAIMAFLFSLGTAIIGYFIFRQVSIMACSPEMDNIYTDVSAVLFIMFIALITGIVALVLKGFITWFEEIKLKDNLKLKNQEIELALVKSQLDPHFLFNTINNIDVLILKDATTASNYLNKLSDIMRFMLFDAKPDYILLSKEIAYIEKYIELQKIRTTNKNYVSFEVRGLAEGRLIAPMVFIPFIENAFKHTNNKKTENAIVILMTIKSKTVQLICENKFDPNRQLQQSHNGLGNDLILKRLNLIYPDQHQLEIKNADGKYSISLTIING